VVGRESPSAENGYVMSNGLALMSLSVILAKTDLNFYELSAASSISAFAGVYASLSRIRRFACVSRTP
jgi:hypothetical protein